MEMRIQLMQEIQYFAIFKTLMQTKTSAIRMYLFRLRFIRIKTVQLLLCTITILHIHD